MADNIGVLDATNVTRTVKTKDTAGVHTPYHRVETSAGVVVDTFVGPASGTLTDRSGTITTGGTAQQAMATNTSRKYVAIENPASALLSPQRDLWYSWTGTAVVNGAGSHLLQPGESVVSVSFAMTNALSIIGATTSQPFTAEEG